MMKRIILLLLILPYSLLAQPIRGLKKAQKNLVSFASPWTSPFKVDPNHPHHLINREGEHLLILNKTAWAYFASADPRGVLERAREQGVNVIRVTLEGDPYFDHLKMDMWPWGGTRQNPDYSRFNEPYWDEVERRVRLAGEYGIGINLTLYFNTFKSSRPVNLHTRQEDMLPHQQAYWAYTLKRLGNYANILTWEIYNEYLGHEEFQDQAGRYFAKHDPWRRPVITSDGTTDDAAWPQKDWMGMAIVHTCTGSTDNHPLYGWYLAVARNTRSHGKPAFNNESGREVRHRNDDPIHRRKQSWIWYAAGCHWTWHSWEGCEGIDDPDYRGPGQEFLKPVTTFFRSLPFWKMEPNFTIVQVTSQDMFAVNLAEPSRQTSISYLCTHRTGKQISGETAKVRLPNGLYKISFIDPVTLENLGSTEIQSASLGRLYDLPLPAFTDDLAIKIDRVQVAERTVIKGTE